MGDEYKCNNNPQQQHLYHHRYSSFHQRTTATTFLLPMLCRLSIKDVRVVKQCKDRSPSSISKDPSSPKVSCIGQVKRRNSKIHAGFPTPHNLFISSSIKHTKLKRFFSGKNQNAAAAGGDGEFSCRELSRRNTSARKVKSDENSDVGVKVSELDPPLPVVHQPPGGQVKSLWSRRRCGGASLKTLEIHYIYYLANNNQIIPPTTL